MTTLTVEINVTLDPASGAPQLDSVTSCTPTGDGIATLNTSASPPKVTVDDYECDTVVVKLNESGGQSLDESHVSTTISPRGAPITHSWSGGAPLTLTVGGLSQVGRELDEDVDLSIASSSGDPIFVIKRTIKP